MPSPTLPALSAAPEVAAAVAVAMSEVARSAYSEEAMAAFDAADQSFDAAPAAFRDPAKLVRDVVDSYLLCAGDFVSGMQYVIAPEHSLLFSPGPLARSAAEYANRASWVGEAGLDINQRILRALALFKNTLKEEAALLDDAGRQGLSDLGKSLNEWHQASGLGKVPALPGMAALFTAAQPAKGATDYKYLCNAAHGSLLTVMLGRMTIAAQLPDRDSDTWWKVLVACGYGLNAAFRVSAVHGETPPPSLEVAAELVADRMTDFNGAC